MTKHPKYSIFIKTCFLHHRETFRGENDDSAVPYFITQAETMAKVESIFDFEQRDGNFFCTIIIFQLRFSNKREYCTGLNIWYLL